ncbi:MAG: proC [Gammaproteobacteria bacterium]|jgi:pyrroline-5-carboxylate reductase|nr:proC [Gammaproteobacteria bacterium]
MGSSLLEGLLTKQYPSEKITITDVSVEKLNQIKKRFNVNTTTNNLDATEKSDIIIFAIKPQIFSKIALELSVSIQQKKPLVISIAAGITVSSIQNWLGGEIPIIRSMPNTPALIGCGATALFANDYITQKQRHLAETILRAVGITLWLDEEKLIDAVTALSGSGPAYFFLIIEALQQAGERLGLSKEFSRLLTLQTAYGAARMALESEKSITELRKAVTSPGGTTEQGIKILEEANIREIMAKATLAAKKRAEELGS